MMMSFVLVGCVYGSGGSGSLVYIGCGDDFFSQDIGWERYL